MNRLFFIVFLPWVSFAVLAEPAAPDRIDFRADRVTVLEESASIELVGQAFLGFEDSTLNAAEIYILVDQKSDPQQIQSVRAEKEVVLISQGREFRAAHLLFDNVARIAYLSENVEIVDGPSHVKAAEAEFDLDSGQYLVKGGVEGTLSDLESKF